MPKLLARRTRRRVAGAGAVALADRADDLVDGVKNVSLRVAEEMSDRLDRAARSEEAASSHRRRGAGLGAGLVASGIALVAAGVAGLRRRTPGSRQR